MYQALGASMGHIKFLYLPSKMRTSKSAHSGAGYRLSNILGFGGENDMLWRLTEIIVKLLKLARSM